MISEYSPGKLVDQTGQGLFFNLPREIRDMIYSYLTETMTDRMWIQYSGLSPPPKNGCTCCQQEISICPTHDHSLQFLCTCGQVWREMWPNVARKVKIIEIDKGPIVLPWNIADEDANTDIRIYTHLPSSLIVKGFADERHAGSAFERTGTICAVSLVSYISMLIGMRLTSSRFFSAGSNTTLFEAQRNSQ